MLAEGAAKDTEATPMAIGALGSLSAPQDPQKKKRKMAHKAGIADKSAEKVATDIDEELLLVSHLEERSEDEDKTVPDMLYSFVLFMQKDPAKQKSWKAYVALAKQLMMEHGRSVDAMASDDYVKIIKGLPRNKSGHNRFGAALAAFQKFMLQRSPGDALEKAPAGDKLYFFGAGPRTRAHSERPQNEGLTKSSVAGMRGFMASFCKKPEAVSENGDTVPTSPSAKESPCQDAPQNEPPSTEKKPKPQVRKMKVIKTFAASKPQAPAAPQDVAEKSGDSRKVEQEQTSRVEVPKPEVRVKRKYVRKASNTAKDTNSAKKDDAVADDKEQSLQVPESEDAATPEPKAKKGRGGGRGRGRGRGRGSASGKTSAGEEGQEAEPAAKRGRSSSRGALPGASTSKGPAPSAEERDAAISKLNALPAANEAEITAFDAVAEAFRADASAKGVGKSHEHMLRLWGLFQEDEKSLDVMASQEYSDLISATSDREVGIERHETLQLFAAFWKALGEEERKALLASESRAGAGGPTKHEARLRRELNLPWDWQLSVTPTRDRGDIVEIRSHDGRVFKSIEDAKVAAAEDEPNRVKRLVGPLCEGVKKAKIHLLRGFVQRQRSTIKALMDKLPDGCSEEQVLAVVKTELERRSAAVYENTALSREKFNPLLMDFVQKKRSGVLLRSKNDQKILGLFVALPENVSGRPAYMRCDAWFRTTGEEGDADDLGEDAAYLCWSAAASAWVIAETEDPDSAPSDSWVGKCPGTAGISCIADDPAAVDPAQSAWQFRPEQSDEVVASAVTPDQLLRVALEFLRTRQQICRTCGTAPDDSETLAVLNSMGEGSVEVEEQARINRLGWESIDDVPDATEEDKRLYPRMLATYYKWLLNDVTSIGLCSKNGYVFSMKSLFEDDPKSPADMATQEFCTLVKKDERNRTGNGQRQAAIAYWIPFWQAFKEKNKAWDELPKDPKERRRFEVNIGVKRNEGSCIDVQQEIQVPFEQLFPEQSGQEGGAGFLMLRKLVGDDDFLIQEVDAAGLIPSKVDLRMKLPYATPDVWQDVPKILKTLEVHLNKQQQSSNSKKCEKTLKVTDVIERLRDLFSSEALSPDDMASDAYQTIARDEQVSYDSVKAFRSFWHFWKAERADAPFVDPSKGTFCPGVMPRLYKVIELKDAIARATRRREVYAKYKIPTDWVIEVNSDLSVVIWSADGGKFDSPEAAAAEVRRSAEERSAEIAEVAAERSAKDSKEEGDAGKEASGDTEKKRTRSSGFKAMQKADGITTRLQDSLRDLVLRRHEWRLLGVRALSSSACDEPGELIPLAEAANRLDANKACAVFLFDARAAKQQLEKKLRGEWALPDEWRLEVFPRLGGNLTIATDPKGRKYFTKHTLEVQARMEIERQRRIRAAEQLMEAVKLLGQCVERPVLELSGMPLMSTVHRAQGIYIDSVLDGRREYKKASAFNLAHEEASCSLRLVMPRESGWPEPRWVIGGGPKDPAMGLAWGVAAEESIASGMPPAIVGQWQVWQGDERCDVYVPESDVRLEAVPADMAKMRVAEVLQRPVACCDFCAKPHVARSLASAEADAKLGMQGREVDPEVLQAKDLKGMVRHMVSKLLNSPGGEGQRLKEVSVRRKLRIGTMCSGTDSPILAIRAVASALGGGCEVDHLFSCEFDAVKQKFLKANYPDMGLLFGDVTTLGGKQALDVISGKKQDVPGNADVIIAGFSCKDLSGMNRNRKTLEEMGQSGQTLQGCLDYVATYRPRAVIFENVRNICARSPETDLRQIDLVMVALRKLGYNSGWKLVDTCNFYLPQTRSRVWMWGYRDETRKPSSIPKKAPIVERLAEELVAAEDKVAAVKESEENAKLNARVDSLLEKLQEPAAVHFDDLLLPDDNPAVQEYIDSLTGRDKNKSVILKNCKITWDVKIQQHRDALRNRFSKPYTSYRGAPWLSMLNPRERDLCDLNFNEVYEQRGIDARQHPMLWELSQSAGRVPGTKTREHRMHCSPCILPGHLWHTTRRRYLLGREKLRLQGIFEEDLVDVSVVSEKVLGDLAGNAFSATVAAANILAMLVNCEF